MTANRAGRWGINLARTTLAIALVFIPLGLAAQSPEAIAKRNPYPVQAFHLNNAAAMNEANEILVAIRNMLDPSIKVYLDASQNTILLAAPPEQIAAAQKIIDELDHPKKLYRLTFTISEVDGAKRVTSQHFDMVVTPGQRGMLRQGTKVPVVSGSCQGDSSTPRPQVTYTDVGMFFDVTVYEYNNGLSMASRVDQSTIAEEKPGLKPLNPVLHHMEIDGTSYLVPGKPLVLGTFAVPGSTRHSEVEVVAEVLP
jgi:hypothetical protein